MHNGFDSAIRLDGDHLVKPGRAAVAFQQTPQSGHPVLGHLKTRPARKLTLVIADGDFFLARVAAER